MPLTIRLLLVAFCAVPVSACILKQVAAPRQPRSETVVLLRDDQAHVLGSAFVSNAFGSVDLVREGQAARVLSDRAPVVINSAGSAEVAEIFGDVLSTLPPPPEHFLLHFRFKSAELTDQAAERFPEILQALKTRPVPEIVLVGHTDTSGARGANIELGFERARSVRALFVDAGIDADSITVRSQGEGVPLVQTADETREPANRRVEIVVR